MSPQPVLPARRILAVAAILGVLGLWPWGPPPFAQADGATPAGVTVAVESVERRRHLIEQMPIAAPTGELGTIGSVADVRPVNGPTSIQHRERAITIQVTPPASVPLERALATIESNILAPPRAEGKPGGSYDARLSGAAETLTAAWDNLKSTLVLALVLTYLPMAALGGFLGIGALHAAGVAQPLDTLTMLGFVILIGTVANNAILIVHQALNLMRADALPHREAIRESVRTRIRPIFMSVGRSVLGMMPLVLFQGAGPELHRGLGSVVVGGLVVSTVFALLLVPALFSLVPDARGAVVARFDGARERPEANGTGA